eukprot:scaffold759_cov290-Alexandrium_tamarense.AAC.56
MHHPPIKTVLVLMGLLHLAISFVPPQRCQPRHVVISQKLTSSPLAKTLQLSQQLSAKLEEDDQLDNLHNGSSLDNDNFDGEGFSNYLGPYALALVVSLAVTAGFVKFVLIDY